MPGRVNLESALIERRGRLRPLGTTPLNLVGTLGHWSTPFCEYTQPLQFQQADVKASPRLSEGSVTCDFSQYPPLELARWYFA